MLKLYSNIRVVVTFGFLFIQIFDVESQIDYTQNRIQLLPDDLVYVRYINEGHVVSCIGEEYDNLTWTRPDGRDVESRGRVHFERFGNILRLVFESTKKEDQGKWTCRLEEDDVKEKSFVMKVYVPIVFEAVEPILSVKEDSDATIPCEVNGYPIPKIHWYFNGMSLHDKLNHEEHRYKKLEDGLFIRKVDRSNAGEYTCKALQISEMMTNVKEQTVRLNVQFKPVMMGHHHRIKYGFIDGDVNLTCEADAEPRAKFIWYRHGRKISKNIHTGDNFSLLHVTIISNDSFGEYKCKAKNEFGEKDHIITLIEGIKPEAPKMFDLRGLSSDTFDIDVGAKVDPNRRHRMDINGYRFELISSETFRKHKSWNNAWMKDFANADGATYLLSPLSANTTYLIRVASRNAAGFSDWSETKNFTTLVRQAYITAGASTFQSSLFFLICSIVVRQIVEF